MEAVLEACLAELAARDVPLLLVNLEDLWLEELPQNTPGTGSERPNWRRRARYGLEEMRRSPAVQRILRRIENRRSGPGDPTR
jgi:4-alpha-glucanotransferase